MSKSTSESTIEVADSASAPLWSAVIQVFKRPFPLTMRVVWPLLVLMALVLAYVFLPEFTAQRSQHWPELALDRMAPVQPAWAVIYGSHLLFVLFPALILREEEQIRRTLWAIVMVWAVAVAFFVVFPTVIHRPAPDQDGGFFAWSLRVVYVADRPYNCFPSLHVAHAFVSAFACHPIHRGVGLGCGVWATLIGISTVFTKQHYVADVLAGVLLAWLAWRLFLRGYSSPTIPRCEKRAAPVLLLATIGCWSIVVAGFGSYYWAVGPGFPSKETPKLPGIDLSSYVHGWDLCQLCGSKRERTDAAQSERLPEGTPW